MATPGLDIELGFNAVINGAEKAFGTIAKMQREIAKLENRTNKLSGSKATNRSSNNPGTTIDKFEKSQNRASASTAKLTKHTTFLSKAFGILGDRVAFTAEKFYAYTVVSKIIGNLTRAIGGTVKQALEFDRQLVRLQQLSNDSNIATKGLGNQITSLAVKYGQSSNELAKSAQVFLQSGRSITETASLLKQLAPTGLTATFGDLTKTSESFLAVSRQFNIGVNQATQVFDSFNTVAENTNVSVEELFDSLRRGGSAFAALSGATGRGIGDLQNLQDLREFAALSASIQSVTRESAATTGTSLRTITPRLLRPQTVSLLKEFNIELRDLEGNFVGPAEAFRRISDVLQTQRLTGPSVVKLLEQLGGTRQFGRAVAAITNAAEAQQLLIDQQRSAGSVANDVALAQQNLTVQIQKLREEFLGFSRELILSDQFQAIAKSAVELGRVLIRLADSVTPILPIIAVAGGLKLGRIAKGKLGFNEGGMVDVSLTKGEGVIFPKSNPMGGTPRGLTALSRSVALVTSGSNANVDSVNTKVPVGTEVIPRNKTRRRLRQGFNRGGFVGGGFVSNESIINSFASSNQQLFGEIEKSVRNQVRLGTSMEKALDNVVRALFRGGNDIERVNKVRGLTLKQKQLRGGGTASGRVGGALAGAGISPNEAGFQKNQRVESLRQQRQFNDELASAGRRRTSEQLSQDKRERRASQRRFENSAVEVGFGNGRRAPRLNRDQRLLYGRELNRSRQDALGNVFVQEGPFAPRRFQQKAQYEAQAAARQRASASLNILTNIKKRTPSQKLANETLSGFQDILGASPPGGNPTRGPSKYRRTASFIDNKVANVRNSALLSNVSKNRGAIGFGAAAAGGFLLSQAQDPNSIVSQTLGSGNSSVLGSALAAGGAGLAAGGPVAAAAGVLIGLESGIRNVANEARRLELDQVAADLSEFSNATVNANTSFEIAARQLQKNSNKVKTVVREAAETFSEQQAEGFTLSFQSGLANLGSKRGDSIGAALFGGSAIDNQLSKEERTAFSRATAFQQLSAATTDIFSGKDNARRRLAQQQQAVLLEEQKTAAAPQIESITRQLTAVATTAVRQQATANPQVLRIRRGEEVEDVIARLAPAIDKTVGVLSEDNAKFLAAVNGKTTAEQGAAIAAGLLEEEIKKVIPAIRNQLIIDGLNRSLQALEDNAAAASARLLSLENSTSSISSSFNAISNLSVGSLNRVASGTFSNQTGVGVGGLLGQLKSSNILGSATAQTVALVSDLGNIQNNFVKSLNRRGTRAGDTGGQVISDTLNSLGVSQGGRDLIDKFLRDSKDQPTATELLSGNTANNLVKEFVKLFADPAKQAEEGLSALAKQSETLAGLLDKRAALTVNSRIGFGNIASQALDARFQVTEALGGQRTRNAGLLQRQARLSQLGFGPNATNRTITKSGEDALNALKNTPVGSAREKLIIQLKSVQEALKINADRSGELADVQRELANIERARTGARSFFEQAAGGGPDALREMTRNTRNFARLLNGQRLRSRDIAPALQQGRQLLDTVTDRQIQNGALNAAFGRKVTSRREVENLIARGLTRSVPGANKATIDLLRLQFGNTQNGAGNRDQLAAANKLNTILKDQIQAAELLQRLNNAITDPSNAIRALQQQMHEAGIRLAMAAEQLKNARINVVMDKPVRVVGTETLGDAIGKSLRPILAEEIKKSMNPGNGPN